MHVRVCKRDREGEIQREIERWGEQQTQRELEGGRERERETHWELLAFHPLPMTAVTREAKLHLPSRSPP